MFCGAMETTQYKEGGGMSNGIQDWNKITNGTDGGGDDGFGSLALELPCPMANYGVPPFLTKLFKIVNDKTTDSIISWGSTSSFIILDEQRFKSEILSSYFKTSRLDSFASQLNNFVSLSFLTIYNENLTTNIQRIISFKACRFFA